MTQIEPQWWHAAYLDASAAVKLVTDETGNKALRGYLAEKRGGFLMTAFCFYEALSALKAKWKRKDFSQEGYRDRCYLFLSYFRGNRIHIDRDLDISELSVFGEVDRIVKTYNLDLSDALQIVTVARGRWSLNQAESKTVFVSADDALVAAAEKERLRVWHLLRSPFPDP